MFRIKLTVQTPQREAFKGRDAFRIRIVASNAENMPNEIFGFQRSIVDGVSMAECDEFSFVCSPYDLSLYPANEPNPSQSPAFFRKDTIDILVPGITVADETIKSVEAQVCQLIKLLEQLDELTEQTVWCPSAPDESDSEV